MLAVYRMVGLPVQDQGAQDLSSSLTPRIFPPCLATMFMRCWTILSMLTLTFAFFHPSKLTTARAASSLAANSFYDIVEKTGDGKDFPMANFKGKVVYGVNVATKCGYTASGYALISKLAALKDKGEQLQTSWFHPSLRIHPCLCRRRSRSFPLQSIWRTRAG